MSYTELNVAQFTSCDSMIAATCLDTPECTVRLTCTYFHHRHTEKNLARYTVTLQGYNASRLGLWLAKIMSNACVTHPESLNTT